MGNSIYKRVIVLAISAGLLSLAFNNCAKSNLAGNGAADEASEEPEDLTSSPICKTTAIAKVQAEEAARKLPANLKTETFRTADKMLVVTDAECLKKQGAKTWLSQQSLDSIKNKTATDSQYNAAALQISSSISGEALEVLANSDPCILRVDKNVKVTINAMPNDTYFSKETHLTAINFQGVVEKMYNSANGINQTVRVAVLDTGIDASHPDLQPLLLRDAYGKLIALNGYNNTTDVNESGFHGTHVAGLIAANGNNGIGITGVMGQNIRIMPVKVSTDGESMDMAAIVNGIYWATQNGASVINMSLGSTEDVPAFREAVKYATSNGVFVAVSAGNNGLKLGVPADQGGINKYPAMYSKDIEGMITVGSYDATTKAISSFSNTSNTWVDIMAPGSDTAGSGARAGSPMGILSTYPANLTNGAVIDMATNKGTLSTGYAQYIITSKGQSPINGTSMSTPVMAGVAAAAIALAKSRGYTASPDQIESLINVGSDSVSAYSNAAKGGKSANLTKLLATVDSDTGLSLSSATSRTAAKGNLAISLQPVGAKLPLGTYYEMSVGKTANSSILVDYQWYKNGLPITTQRGPKLRIPAATSSDRGDYYVQLKAGTTIVKSQVATISIDGSGCP